MNDANRRAGLCYLVPATAGSFTAAIMIGGLQPPPSATALRAAVLMAVFFNVALAFAGPALHGVWQGGTLTARVVRSLGYGIAGAGAHWAIVIAAGAVKGLANE